MGSTLSNSLFPSTVVNTVIVGLDAAGKTTLLYKLKVPDQPEYVSLFGYSVESTEYRNFRLTAFDVGVGGSRQRLFYRHFYEEAKGLVFVVDSCDRERVDEAKQALQTVLDEELQCGVPVLILANKSDLPSVMSTAEVTARLDLHGIRGRNWKCVSVSIVKGEGVEEALEWLGGIYQRKMTTVTAKGQ